MNLREHRGKLTVGVGILALLLVVVVWVCRPSPTAVRLTFLYATNHLQNGRVGVFEVVNQMQESVRAGIGFYKPANRSGLNVQFGDLGATILSPDARNCAAGATNILHVWAPTNGGPYRLVLMCLPASKSTPQFFSSVRFRFERFISRWIKPSIETEARWYGRIFVESQSFEITP